MSIDTRMDERRKEYREKRLREEIERFRRERPKIQQMFTDLKRGLTTVSVNEWEALPEVGDFRTRKQRGFARAERYTPVPDSVLAKGLADSGLQGGNIALDPREQMYGGLTTPAGVSTPAGDIDMKKIGQARTSLMDIKLTQVRRECCDVTVEFLLF